MIRTIISVDPTLPATKQSKNVIHNRWHPEIPHVAQVDTGEVFKVECLDCLGNQILNNDGVEDIINLDFHVPHYLSGPIRVNGAEPGDLLVLDILDVQPYPGHEWGYTAIIGKSGFLHEYYDTPTKAIWDFQGIYATSRHIPGVKIAGISHPGVIGCAPSKELLAEWNKRELELLATDPDRVPPLVAPPCRNSALVGLIEGTSIGERVKEEGARTLPPRENGGNCDIKNISKGSKVYLPVYIDGANFSIGDLHFSEGDGEITLCGAIEMCGILTLKTSIIKNGVKLHSMINPVFLPGPVEPRYNRYLTFEGISVDEEGKQHYLDATLAYKRACLNCIKYFENFGYTPEQVYLLLSSAPVEGRISGIVDYPNACCTLAVPVDIFEFDVLPKDGGPTKVVQGQKLLRAHCNSCKK